MPFLTASDRNVNQTDYDNFNVSAVYNKLGADYEAYILEDAGRQRCVDWALSSLSERGVKRGQCIDLGCASGVPVTASLVAAGHDVIGVDLADGQVQLARERVPDAKFVVADMRKWQPADEGFKSVDAVVTFYALPHLSVADCKLVLSRIHKWLSDEGVLALGMVNGVNGKVKWFGFEIIAMSMSLEQMNGMLEETGFEVVKSWEEGWTSSANKDARSKLNQFFWARKKRQI